MKNRKILDRKINPLYGYITVVLLIAGPVVGALIYNYLSDTHAHRQAQYQQMLRECGQAPYIIPVKSGLFGEDYDHATGPISPQYSDKLKMALMPHTPYEFRCSNHSAFF